MDDKRARMGLLTPSDAARFLRMPRQRFSRWAHGYEHGEPLLHVVEPPHPWQASIPFVGIAEAYVLDALRTAGVKPHKIRPALDRLKREFGEYALVAQELATDGIDVLWDFSRGPEGRDLIEATTGQAVIRAVVTDYLRYIGRAEDGYPNVLTLRHWQPDSEIIINPYRQFGAPIFRNSGTRVMDVMLMLEAGEDPEVVADELGVTSRDVITAARILVGHAA